MDNFQNAITRRPRHIYSKNFAQMCPSFLRSLPTPHCSMAANSARKGAHRARALGRNAQPRRPFVGVFCEPFLSFGTIIQSSPKSFSLSNTPSPISSRLGECRVYFVVEDPPQGFHQTWVMILGVSVFERGFRLQATKFRPG